MKNEKYNIIIDNGINRIIAEGPFQTVIDDSEHGGYTHFLFNLRIENKEGRILSSILNKVPFASMSRSGADLDEEYTMEGFYLTKDSFGYLRGESWTSLTNPLEWSRSINFDISKKSNQAKNIEFDEFLRDCEFTYNGIEGESIEVLNKYLDVLISFEKQGSLPSQCNNQISWDNIQRVILISQSK